MHSDWLKQGIQLATYNHSALFQRRVLMPIINCFRTSAPSSKYCWYFTHLVFILQRKILDWGLRVSQNPGRVELCKQNPSNQQARGSAAFSQSTGQYGPLTFALLWLLLNRRIVRYVILNVLCTYTTQLSSWARFKELLNKSRFIITKFIFKLLRYVFVPILCSLLHFFLTTYKRCL